MMLLFLGLDAQLCWRNQVMLTPHACVGILISALAYASICWLPLRSQSWLLKEWYQRGKILLLSNVFLMFGGMVITFWCCTYLIYLRFPQPYAKYLVNMLLYIEFVILALAVGVVMRLMVSALT